MNCQEAIERLPWWLNGSLDPEERREVEEHLKGCGPCRQALEETRLAAEIFAQHIPTAALVAYAADEAPEGIDPGLFELHLADCPQCAAELEMARASRLLSEHEEVPLLLPRQPPQASPAAARPARAERGWKAAAIAAGMTSVLALSGLWLNLERQGAAGPAAYSGAFGDLDTLTRGGETAGIKAFPKSAGFAAITLHPSDADTFRDHTFEVKDPSGKVVVPERALLRDKDNFYLVIVDLRSLPPGTYAIQTYGTDGGRPQPLDRFSFLVR